MPKLTIDIKGLTAEEILISRKKSGENVVDQQEKSGFLTVLINAFKEPIIEPAFYTKQPSSKKVAWRHRAMPSLLNNLTKGFLRVPRS